ncbi:MAG: GNAT family N-acetyltransferase [Mariprofundus sp.]|nr:GNAT family N-acetyltransferase [Mariprofundus sp.]
MTNIKPTPWDSAAFGMDCFEITQYDLETLSLAATTTGHYTIKIDPLADKTLLHQYGFHYTDTLIEPVCLREKWLAKSDPLATIDHHITLEQLLPMCDQSFLHGRFHRDFNIMPEQADARYKQWLKQMHQAGQVFGLCYSKQLVGFIAASQGNLLLHTIAKPYRGKGLAKPLWTAAISEIFSQGYDQIRSSISASNMAVLNLYVSLGFRFEHPVDIYHRLSH